MVGGGPRLSPGEVTLADQGTLFCDELAEFGRDVLEALRQPLEDGSVAVVRVGRAEVFPARFTFVAAMNPCPCGQLGAADRTLHLPAGRPGALPAARLRPAPRPDRPLGQRGPRAARGADRRGRARGLGTGRGPDRRGAGAPAGTVGRRAERPRAAAVAALDVPAGPARPRVARSRSRTVRGCRVAGRSGCSASHGRSRTWAGRRPSPRTTSTRRRAIGRRSTAWRSGRPADARRRQGGRVAAVGGADRRRGGRRTGARARRRDQGASRGSR